MRQVIGTVLFSLLLFSLLLGLSFAVAQADLFVNIWQGLKDGLRAIFNALGYHPRPWPPDHPRFDIATARRESHALGLPFPESDGTLSLPPEPKSLPVGEPRFVIDRVRGPRELPDPVWVDRAHREGWTCATHGPDCDLRTQWCRLVAFGWRRVPSERELEIAYEALYGKGQDLR